MKKLFTTVAILSLGFATQAQTNMGINTATPSASAALMIDTAATGGPQGILIPRMLQARRNAIANPANGLLIYQTDGTAGFYYNTGTPAAPAWQTLGAAGANGTNGTNGTNGQGFVNGTGPTQVYVTNTGAPYAPTNPVSITGDVSLASTGITTIGTNAVTTAKIADGSITTPKVVNGGITAVKIADGAVNNNKVADGAVTTSKIADANVTIAKISTSNTASAATFLRGDGSWAAPAAGTVAFFGTSTVTSTNTNGNGTYYLNFGTGASSTESDAHRILALSASSVKLVIAASGTLTSGYTVSIRRGTSNGSSYSYTDIGSSATLSGATAQTINVTGLTLNAGETVGVKIVGTATFVSNAKSIYYTLTAQ